MGREERKGFGGMWYCGGGGGERVYKESRGGEVEGKRREWEVMIVWGNWKNRGREEGVVEYGGRKRVEMWGGRVSGWWEIEGGGRREEW